MENGECTSAVGAKELSPALQRWVGVDFISEPLQGRHSGSSQAGSATMSMRVSLPAFAKTRRKAGAPGLVTAEIEVYNRPSSC